MRKVITYGTFDLLHKGHVALLERAKALGDYLIVGVTSDQFDKGRGKLNVHQSTIERVDAVRATGLADLVIIEEYEGQKIEDIQRYGVDVFTVGSDWRGHFDYLSSYCEVVYLDRTQGVSSSQLRNESAPRIRIGVIGDPALQHRFEREMGAVGSLRMVGGCRDSASGIADLIKRSDALIVTSEFHKRRAAIERCLAAGKHVLYVPPAFKSEEDARRMANLAQEKGIVLFNGVKTKYLPAFRHLMLLVGSGAIGDIRSIDLSCSQVPSDFNGGGCDETTSAMAQWGGLGFLPALELMGRHPDKVSFRIFNNERKVAYYTRCYLDYPEASVQVTMGQGIKTEGDMVITGTKGYVYVPAPWWLTDYFEIRNEDANGTRKFYWGYQGDGLRYELLEFAKRVRNLSTGDSEGRSDDEWYASMVGQYLQSEASYLGESK